MSYLSVISIISIWYEWWSLKCVHVMIWSLWFEWCWDISFLGNRAEGRHSILQPRWITLMPRSLSWLLVLISLPDTMWVHFLCCIWCALSHKIPHDCSCILNFFREAGHPLSCCFSPENRCSSSSKPWGSERRGASHHQPSSASSGRESWPGRRSCQVCVGNYFFWTEVPRCWVLHPDHFSSVWFRIAEHRVSWIKSEFYMNSQWLRLYWKNKPRVTISPLQPPAPCCDSIVDVCTVVCTKTISQRSCRFCPVWSSLRGVCHPLS